MANKFLAGKVGSGHVLCPLCPSFFKYFLDKRYILLLFLPFINLIIINLLDFVQKAKLIIYLLNLQLECKSCRYQDFPLQYQYSRDPATNMNC